MTKTITPLGEIRAMSHDMFRAKVLEGLEGHEDRVTLLERQVENLTGIVLELRRENETHTAALKMIRQRRLDYALPVTPR